MALFNVGKGIAEKIHFILSLIIRLSLLVAIIGSIIEARWTVLFVSSLAFVLTFLPAIIKRNYKIVLPVELELVMVLFIFTSLFLGEVHKYYTRFWWWDVVLHTGSGLALGFIGFLILFVLYENDKLQARPSVIAMFSFCFAMAIGGVWEIFEFAMDQLFGFNMQKTGLIDTMWDLIVDAGGALFTSIIGYIYLREGKTRIFRRLIDSFVCKNPKLFSESKVKCEE